MTRYWKFEGRHSPSPLDVSLGFQTATPEPKDLVVASAVSRKQSSLKAVSYFNSGIVPAAEMATAAALT